MSTFALHDFVKVFNKALACFFYLLTDSIPNFQECHPGLSLVVLCRFQLFYKKHDLFVISLYMGRIITLLTGGQMIHVGFSTARKNSYL